MQLGLGIALSRIQLLAVSGEGEVPANAILFNGVPLLFNGNYIIFTES
jgi:hypothetical protein